MRSLVVRQRLVRVAAVASSVALLAACGAKPGTPTSGTNGDDGTAGIGTAIAAGMLLVSDGTNVVTVGDQKITFPTKVTDAAWSPDGSRIAFVDGDGNIATARPNGSNVVVLTAAKAGAVRSRPAWQNSRVAYAEKRADGTSVLMFTNADNCNGQIGNGEINFDTGDGTGYIDLAPSASDVRMAGGTKTWRLAFQHDEPTGPQIWITDDTQRTPHTGKLADGSEPAVSPDSKRVAYVGKNGQVMVRGFGGAPEASIQVTFGAAAPKRLTWTPDGSHIVFSTAADIESVSADVVAGATSNPSTAISPTPGVPTFLRPARDTVSRITGADTIELAIAASQAHYPTSTAYFPSQGYRGAFGAMISPFNASGPPVNANATGPLLLTGRDALDPRTKTELQRLFGQVGPNTGQPMISLVGGTDVLSVAVEQALKGMGYQVTRLVGGSVNIAASATPCAPFDTNITFHRQTLVVVDGTAGSDAMVAWSLGRSAIAPVLAIDPKAGLTDAVKDYLKRASASIDDILIVDQAGTIPADLDKQIGDLVAGPLGFAQNKNPTVPALAPVG